MLTAETQMALGEIRGVARIFPQVRTFFSNLLPIDVISSPLSTAKTGLDENYVFTFYTVPLAI